MDQLFLCPNLTFTATGKYDFLQLQMWEEVARARAYAKHLSRNGSPVTSNTKKHELNRNCLNA